MIFAGPCSPRFTADTLVVSVNVGEGGPAPGEALRFPCELVVIANGRRGRDFGIGERGCGLVAAEGEEREEGLDVQSKPLVEIGAFTFGRPQVVSRAQYTALRSPYSYYREEVRGNPTYAWIC
jgi:hypothetical protein